MCAHIKAVTTTLSFINPPDHNIRYADSRAISRGPVTNDDGRWNCVLARRQ